MKINFYATLRDVVGQKTVYVDTAPGITVQQLLERLVADYPALRNELLDADNRFHSHMKMFINGRNVIYLEDRFDTALQIDDTIDIFPPVGGG